MLTSLKKATSTTSAGGQSRTPHELADVAVAVTTPLQFSPCTRTLTSRDIA